MNARLGGGIRFNGPAETLLSFSGQAGHALAGPVGVAADFSCRVDDPCLDGIVRANALTYQNQQYGTRLTGMAVNGRLSGNQLVIDSLRAATCWRHVVPDHCGLPSSPARLRCSAGRCGYPKAVTRSCARAHRKYQRFPGCAFARTVRCAKLAMRRAGQWPACLISFGST